MATAKKAVKRPVRRATARKTAKAADPFAKAKIFVGLKQISAVPMTRGKAVEHRTGNIPAIVGKAEANEKGYLIRYQDGFVSWSSKAVFEGAYAASGQMSFSHALEMAKQGHKIARKGWSKNQWIIWIPGTENVKTKRGSPYKKAGLDTVTICGHFDMFTSAKVMQPGWLASQGDMAANDWGIVS